MVVYLIISLDDLSLHQEQFGLNQCALWIKGPGFSKCWKKSLLDIFYFSWVR